MRVAVSAGVVLALAGLIAGLLWLTLGSDDDGTGQGELGEVLDEIADALSREDEILHSTVSATQGTQSLYSMEFWVDARSGATRIHLTPDSLTFIETTVLIIDGFSYVQESDVAAVRREDAEVCEGVEPWLAALILCESDYEYGLENGVWGDDDAILLIGERAAIIRTPGDLLTPRPTEQTDAPGQGGSGSTEILGGVETFTSRLYVDPTSYLPIAWVREQRLNGEPVDDLGDPVLVYDHEFLQRTDDLQDLFDPGSFGYEEE